MAVNTYNLELMSILLNIFQPQKLMNKTKKVENLFLKRKDTRYYKKKWLKKKLMIQIMKLVKYKHLLVNLKEEN